MPRLTKRKVDAEVAKSKKENRFWDDDLRGLGLRIKRNGLATFFIQYRSPVTFKKTRHSIDQYERLTMEQAHIEAKRQFDAISKAGYPAVEKR